MRKMLLIVAGLAACAGAMAQGFPNKPVRILLPATAGATSDLVARGIAEVLAKNLAQGVYVENRAGADGIIGTEACVNAAPGSIDSV